MIAYLSLGSNLGDREETILHAIRQLCEIPDVALVGQSSIVETEPWGYTKQPQFLNCAVSIETTLLPGELLKACQQIENIIGRKREIHWGPRAIDIDIVFYGDRIIQEEALIIPHPHAHERRFVLDPIAEIAPDFVHPLLKLTIAEMIRRLG